MKIDLAKFTVATQGVNITRLSLAMGRSYHWVADLRIKIRKGHEDIPEETVKQLEEILGYEIREDQTNEVFGMPTD